ncbi:MAG: hypothetical protein Q7R96_05280 [Nanoarchaeota archaeon]|nr:hypothetical protein [Nanoarchaeota archaeon]
MAITWNDIKTYSRNAAIYAAVGLVGFTARGCADEIKGIERVEFPGGDKGLLIHRPLGDLPFVVDDRNNYTRYDESELMRRTKRDE